MSELNLTTAHHAQIKQDMDKQVEMLSDAEVNALAQKVNKHINLPFLGEDRELVVFVKVIKWIDRHLYKLLPNEYYELVKDATDGISKEDAVKLEDRISPLINNLVNIPILTEHQEGKLIHFVLSLIVNAMVKGHKLDAIPSH